jgi:hypothetical protein
MSVRGFVGSEYVGLVKGKVGIGVVGSQQTVDPYFLSS